MSRARFDRAPARLAERFALGSVMPAAGYFRQKPERAGARPMLITGRGVSRLIGACAAGIIADVDMPN